MAAVDYNEIFSRVQYFIGSGTDATRLDAAETARIDSIIREGIAGFVQPPLLPNDAVAHSWSFLRPTGTLKLWMDVVVGSTIGTISAATYSAVTGKTTITTAAATFDSTLVGETLTVKTIGDFVISSITSTTVAVVTGDASAGVGQTCAVNPITAATYDAVTDLLTITVPAATFYASMEKKSLTITGIGSYVIDSYVSTTSVVVSSATDISATVIGKTIAIVSGDSFTFDSEFQGMDGDGLLVQSTTKRARVVQRSEWQLLSHYPTSSIPQECAVRMIRNDGSSAQRYELFVWPSTDGEYDLRYTTILTSFTPTSTNPYLIGSAIHGETILQSCLAAAEKRMTGFPGPEREAYFIKLASSVARDRQTMTPDGLGHYGAIQDFYTEKVVLGTYNGRYSS